MLSPTIFTVRFHLCIGNARSPVATLIPDIVYPGMWRVWAGDRLSDMANFSRAMDAAMTFAERGPPRRDPRLFHWRTTPQREAARRPVVRWLAKDGETPC
jgi:hypothetical protein